MILSKIILVGFRNFKNATINVQEKSLVIGANEVGKTNMIWALRLLLDKTISDNDLEPKLSDFYAYDDDTKTFQITLEFRDVTETFLLSKFAENVSDDGKLYLRYEASKESLSYELFAGSSIETLDIIEGRFYIKVLNIKYLSSRRDFYRYINKEKNSLIHEAKENRDDSEKISDKELYDDIKSGLETVDGLVPKLSYIKSATDKLNTELQKLSIHHKRQEVVFDATSSDVEHFISNVSIGAKNNDKSLFIGGDGRLNQIYLSLWAAKNDIGGENISECSIICIEEPEAHLHPHQQRKLAEYLGKTLSGQILITSHSPQIACEYSPNAIIRLVDKGEGAYAASRGCSDILDAAFIDFGYRMSIIPAEAFFADAVILVEGPSEEIFYKTLAKQLSIDLDRLNISILSVYGVGFATFIQILSALEIAWIIRTDNDVSKIQYKEEYRFAGIQRALHFYKTFLQRDEIFDSILAEKEIHLQGFPERQPPKENLEAAKIIANELNKFNIYISLEDLEKDLITSDIREDLFSHFRCENDLELIEKMQKHKATLLYHFLRKQKDCLTKLEAHSLALPLLRSKEIVESYYD